MKITLHQPPPPPRPPATVLLELSEEEAQKLKVILGGIGEREMRDIIGVNTKPQSLTQEQFRQYFGSDSADYDKAPRQFVDKLFFALQKAGVRT